MYYKDKSENARHKANLRQEISMYLNRIEMIEKTLELFESSNINTELKEFWEETLLKTEWDLNDAISMYNNIPKQE